MGGKWGKTPESSPVFWKRYKTLVAEGFVHDEAALFAEGKISTSEMMRGRRARKEFRRDALAKGLTVPEYEQAVDDLYDSEDWFDEYHQFYPDKHV